VYLLGVRLGLTPAYSVSYFCIFPALASLMMLVVFILLLCQYFLTQISIFLYKSYIHTSLCRGYIHTFMYRGYIPPLVSMCLFLSVRVAYVCMCVCMCMCVCVCACVCVCVCVCVCFQPLPK
jgi:hypothetical protein